MTEAVRENVTLDPAEGGFYVASNCPVCGGGWVVEGGSHGRDRVPKCTEVKRAVYCRACRMQMVLEVRLSVVTQYRNGARSV